MEGEKLSVGRSAALIWIPTVARLWKAKPAGVRPCTISASCGIRKNERAKPECRVQSATSISALPPTIPKKPVDSRPHTVHGEALHLHMPSLLAIVHRTLGGAGRPRDRKILCLASSRRGTTIHAVAAYPVYSLVSTGFQPPKPECHVESATSTFSRRLTITKNWSVGHDKRGGNRASKGLEDRRHGPKCANKAIMRREINDLTQKSKPKTKPKQSR